ncbi:MAG: hypothetical protein AB4041_18280 [Microcystaceae cyanobacterium]
MKPPKGWQQKQWYPEERQSVDLSSRLQSLEGQAYPKLQAWQIGGQKLLGMTAKWLLGLGIMGCVGMIIYSTVGVPWHIKLFGSWLLKKKEISYIPAHLHEELDQLCKTADRNGQVDGYQGSDEIAYGLGRFQCLNSEDKQSWIVKDTYGFDDVNEALAGSQLAEFLVVLWGKDYTYEIKAIIPKKNGSFPWGVLKQL